MEKKTLDGKGYTGTVLMDLLSTTSGAKGICSRTNLIQYLS